MRDLKLVLLFLWWTALDALKAWFGRVRCKLFRRHAGLTYTQRIPRWPAWCEEQTCCDRCDAVLYRREIHSEPRR